MVTTIMCAEDEDANYLLYNAILGRSYHLIRAFDGVEAVQKAKTEPIDLILMDYKMPNMDGIEATRQIRSFKPRLPIIACTANVYFIQDALKEGLFDGFIPKPSPRSFLERIVSDILSKKSA